MNLIYFKYQCLTTLAKDLLSIKHPVDVEFSDVHSKQQLVSLRAILSLLLIYLEKEIKFL